MCRTSTGAHGEEWQSRTWLSPPVYVTVIWRVQAVQEVSWGHLEPTTRVRCLH